MLFKHKFTSAVILQLTDAVTSVSYERGASLIDATVRGKTNKRNPFCNAYLISTSRKAIAINEYSDACIVEKFLCENDIATIHKLNTAVTNRNPPIAYAVTPTEQERAFIVARFPFLDTKYGCL